MYRIGRSALAPLVAVFLVGACSSSATTAPSSAASAAPSTTASAAAASAAASAAPVQGIDSSKVVTLGAWIAQTGPAAAAGACKDAAQLYMDQVNSAGGINGYTFKYDVIDDQDDPTKTVTAVRTLWEQDKVFAIVSPYGSGPMSAVKQYVADNNVPVFAPWADSTIYTGTDGNTVMPNVFGIQASYQDEVKRLAAFAAQDQSVKKIVDVHTTDGYGKTGPEGLTAAAQSLGLTVVDDIGYDLSETNFAPIGQRAAADGADAILLWSFVGGAQIVNAAEQAGFKGTWLWGDVFRSADVVKQLSDVSSLAGRSFLIFHQKTSSQMTADGSNYVQLFTAKYPKDDPDIGLNCWTAMAMFLQGVKEATANGTPLTWDAMRAAFEKWNSVNVEAAVGLSYSSTRHVGAEEAQILALKSDGTYGVQQDFTPLPH